VSRIGRLPITVPAGVKVDIVGSTVSVKGPKGELQSVFSSDMGLSLESGLVHVTRSSDAPSQRALHGTTRAILNNMILGVSTGFAKTLDIDGVGYRAEMSGKNLVLYVGFSHPVTIEPEAGISFGVDTKTRQITISGYNKEQVGQVAANIREIRPPEPYKGKGIRYTGERVRRKAGKSGKTKK
jgi:large subunit ribosomal protein L6